MMVMPSNKRPASASAAVDFTLSTMVPPGATFGDCSEPTDGEIQPLMNKISTCGSFGVTDQANPGEAITGVVTPATSGVLLTPGASGA